MKNPFINNRQIMAAFSAVLVLLCGLSFGIIYLNNDIKFEYVLVDSIIYILLFFIISTSLWYPSKYMTIENNSIVNLVISHLISSGIASVVWIYTGFFIITNIYPDHSQFIESTLLQRFIVGILLYLIMIILNYVIIYYDNFRTKVSEKAELTALVKEAELKSLKYQINPHFIFNSLNSISSLTISDPEKAREMSSNLSAFLRKTLAKNDHSKVKLSEELDNVRLYLNIEKVRFDERLDINFEISESCSGYEIPNMILQPIIENSIKHGVYESTEKVTIHIKCLLAEDFIVISVSNDYDPTAVSNIGEGIGLKNIKDRLALIYNKLNLLSINKENNIFEVILRIPIKRND